MAVCVVPSVCVGVLGLYGYAKEVCEGANVLGGGGGGRPSQLNEEANDVTI